MSDNRTSRAVSRPVWVAAMVAIVFGALTIASGGIVLFGGADMGAVVPFVLWFNFIAGFAYVAAGLGLWRGRRWAVWLSAAIVVATLLVLMAFAVHVAQGGAFESRTVAALLFRTATWAAIASVAYRAQRTR